MAYDSQYHHRKLPKESRTIPLEGSKDRGNGLDYRRYYRCWHCGFVCDIERDALGDDKSVAGIGYSAPTSIADPSINNIGVLGGVARSVVSLELGADGNAKELSGIILYPEVTGGCPLCGTKNWKGEY